MGVLLTGMGEDGAEAMRIIHDQGALTIGESELTCVVYGMPRVVYEAGLSAAEVAIERMATAIAAHL